MVLGMIMIFGSVALLIFNEYQAQKAAQSAASVLPLVQAQVAPEPVPEKVQKLLIPAEFLEPEDLEMTEVVIDGNAYIGYLSIPALGVELPVLSDWSYELLEIAPCRYFGNLREDNLVLMAHNYHKHFGEISTISIGDTLSFTDMDGIVTGYKIVARDVLLPEAVEEMTAGEYDLTLFTCTYGGQSRVAVYCERIP
jgi:sortase A